jgi:DNA-binding protein HU-beta
MNRSQFLNAVADKAKAHRRDVEHVWEAAVSVIGDSMKKGEAVAISGFGKFSQRVTKARKAGMAKNPFTGEMVKVAAKPARKAPKFTPAKPLKEFVAGSAKSLPAKATKPMNLTGNGGSASAAPAKKAPAKKAPAKKAPAKKTAAKKPAAKKAPAKKTAAKKPAAKKTARRR